MPIRVLTAVAAIAATMSLVPASGAERHAAVEAVPGSLVGKVRGTRAYVALSYIGARLRVYVCDGRGRRGTTISHWLSRRWDGRSPLTLRRDGVRVRVTRVHADGRISGSVAAFSGPHPFTVRRATGPAGLYDGIDPASGLRASWIVLADRSIRGTFIPPRPPRRECRKVTVTLSDGTTQERVACLEF